VTLLFPLLFDANRKKRRQLAIVTAVIIALTLLSIGIILAITLPPILEKASNETLSPPDPPELLIQSTSVLSQYDNAGVRLGMTLP
jgi:hypothetical protein